MRLRICVPFERQDFAHAAEYRSGYLVTNYERLRTGVFVAVSYFTRTT